MQAEHSPAGETDREVAGASIAGGSGAEAGQRAATTRSGERPGIDDLRSTFLFETLSDDQLAWLSEHSTEITLEAAERFVAEGAPADALWVLIAGELQLTRTVAGREIVVETSDQPGTWAGWLPMFDDGSPVAGYVRRHSRMLRIPRGSVQHMLDHGFPIAPHLLAGVRMGIQTFEELANQQEKLAALGKLAAGLAHELNNPAAAIRRAASRLGALLRVRDQRMLALGRRLDEQAAARLAGLTGEIADQVDPALMLDPLERSDREDELAVWLEERGVADVYDLAPTLVDAGLEAATLERLDGVVAPDALPDALAWLGETIAAGGLAEEIEQSAARISTLVGAIKEYSYMDQAPEQEIDLHHGLENTLTILQHKLKDITVTREYDRGLPRITAHGSELNQVWTNLIDNAIDAVKANPAGQRRITIRTAREGDWALVEIGDNGMGIPEAVRSRIFDPFFTTKGVGQGSGLGLDISYRIVVRQHDGDIQVHSVPGDTRFQVRLPLKRTPR